MRGLIYQEIRQVRMGLRMLAVETTQLMISTGVTGQLQQITLFTLLSSVLEHNVLYEANARLCVYKLSAGCHPVSSMLISNLETVQKNLFEKGWGKCTSI